MNLRAIISARFFFCIFLFALVSCQKIDFEDYIHPDNTPKLCKIKRILSFTEFNIDTLIWNFNYNQWGDPESIRLNSVQTGRPEFLFRYDHKHRLTDYIGAYRNSGGNFGYETWHRYAYEGNRIVRDTARSLGWMVNGEPVVEGSYGYSIDYITYDSYDRIIKDSIIFPIIIGLPPLIQTYTYNAVGNLAHFHSGYIGGSLSTDISYPFYDSKVNIHRTHKIWMLVDRDYSLNNRITALFYNQYGLPLKMRASEESYPFLYGRNISESDIKYECR